MKITITQTEIEEAVRNHIRSMISVKEGHSITMDFSATRGADGLTAFIDISPDAPAATGTKAPAKQVTETQAPAQTEEPAPTRTRVTRQVLKETTAATQEAVQAETPVETAPVAEEAPFDGGETVQSAEVETPADDGVQEVEGAVPLKRSIFAGLNRPSNSEDGAAAAA